MKHLPPLLTETRVEAFTASALRFVCWVFGLIVQRGFNGQSRKLRDVLRSAERAVEPAALAALLREQKELRGLGTNVLTPLAQAIADSHAQNPHEPLTNRFFMQLERDVLLAVQPHHLAEPVTEAVLDIAELSPPEATVAVGARKEAA